MVIELDYYDVEEAIRLFVKKEYGWDITSEQFQGGSVKMTDTTYVFKKDKDGTKVVDREKTVVKTENVAFDSRAASSFYIDAANEKQNEAEKQNGN